MYVEWDIDKVISMDKNVNAAIQMMLTDVWLCKEKRIWK